MDVVMIYLATVAVALGVATLFRRPGLREAVPLAVRIGLAALFLITGVSHFVGLCEDLVAMFPANVYAATAGSTLGGEPSTALLPRAAMQVAYLASALVVVRTQWPHAVFSGVFARRKVAQSSGIAYSVPEGVRSSRDSSTR